MIVSLTLKSLPHGLRLRLWPFIIAAVLGFRPGDEDHVLALGVLFELGQ
jgi:hypothetical protein